MLTVDAPLSTIDRHVALDHRLDLDRGWGRWNGSTGCVTAAGDERTERHSRQERTAISGGPSRGHRLRQGLRLPHISAISTTLEQNLAIIADSVGYLKDLEEVIFDAEHFFNDFKRNRRRGAAGA